MATKITDLTELAAAPDSTDVLHIIDVGDTTGGAAGTSKKIQVSNLTAGSGGTTTVKVSLSNADVQDMKYDDQPITLKAAEVGKIIMPLTVICVATHAGSNESSSYDLRMGWNAASSTTADYWGGSRDWMNGVTTGSISGAFGGTSGVTATSIMTFSLTNQPFQIWSTGDFNGGWSMDVYFSYVIVDE